MAWDPNSSSWDWESDGINVPNYVIGMDPRKLPLASCLGETELAQIKHDGPFLLTNRALCASEVRPTATNWQNAQVDVRRDGSMLTNRVVTPTMANVPGALAFDDAVSHSGFGLQVRLPIVTTCIGNGEFIGGNSHGSGSFESIVQEQLDESQGSVENKSSEGLGAYEKQASAANEMTKGFHQPNLGGDKLCLVDETIGRDHLSTPKHLADKIMGSIYNSDKANVMEEQHSSTARGSAGSGDSLTGLQLGKRIYSLDAATSSAPKATPKLNHAAKKARGGAAQVLRCQVEGCKLDLSSAKDYHRRHKVCESHSKAGKVVVASLEQRFCQQCSRFHPLSEFDETKRSCRRRLAGHNKRRRKPQPDSLELQARLRSSFEDWPFFYQSRFPRLPFWQDAGESGSNILWPRKVMQYPDHSNFDYSMQTLGTDASTKALLPSVACDKFSLLLHQSPRTYVPMGSCDPRVQDYLPELMSTSTVANGLSLASSSIGAGAFTGLETTPVTEVTRVSDSGRALSLLSLHSQCSQASDMVSLDLSDLANTKTINHTQHVQETHGSSQQFLLQEPHPFCQDFSTILSMASNLPGPAAVDGREEAGVMSSDKDFFECSFFNNLHRQSGYEGNQNPMFLNMHMQSRDTTAEVMETQDLMQLAPFQVAQAHRQHSSIVSNLESSALSDSHFSSEAPFLRF